MSFFNDTNREKLEYGESQASFPLPVKIRRSVLKKAYQMARDNPDAQVINEIKNQKKINMTIDNITKFTPTPDSSSTASPKPAEQTHSENATAIASKGDSASNPTTKDGMDVNFIRDRITGIHDDK